MKKFVMTAAVALAMTFAFQSNAATTAELEAQIQALLAQLSALQGGASTSATPFTWNGTLIKQGSKGSQVSALQACMNALGYSTGVVDGIYGPNTFAGITAFQAAKGYKVDGIVGSETSTGFEMACNENGSSDNGGDSNNGTVDDGTEGSVKSYSVAAADETEALEGQEEVEIYAADVELDDDGDLLLERVDVWFSQTATADDDPWEYFKEVHLLVDGDVVASMDADKSSDWSDKATGHLATASTDNEYRMRFTGLNEVFKSDETTKVSIAVTMVNTIDSNDQDAVWVVGIDSTSGFRWVDGTGFVFTEGDSLEDSFTTGNKDAAVIKVNESTDDPDATTIEVDTDNNTSDELIGVFELEETNNVDFNLDEMTMVLTIVDPAGNTGITSGNDVIKNVWLEADGDMIGSKESSFSGTVNANGTSNLTVTFDNLDYDMNGDDTVDIAVMAEFEDTNDGARYDEGTTVAFGTIDLTQFEDDNGNDEGDITETVATSSASATHELRSKGIRVTVVDADNTVTVEDGAVGTAPDAALFTWVLDIEAFGDSDIYINGDAARVVSSASATEVDDVYVIDVGTGAALVSVTTTIDESDNDVEAVTGDSGAYGAEYNADDLYRIDSGATGTITITVSGTNATQAKQVRAYLSSLEWTSDNVEDASGGSDALTAVMNSYTFDLDDDSKTPYKYVNQLT